MLSFSRVPWWFQRMLVFLYELVVANRNSSGNITVPPRKALILLIPSLTKYYAIVSIVSSSSVSFRTGLEGCKRTSDGALLAYISFASGLWQGRVHIFLLALEQRDSVDFAPLHGSRRGSLSLHALISGKECQRERSLSTEREQLEDCLIWGRNGRGGGKETYIAQLPRHVLNPSLLR